MCVVEQKTYYEADGSPKSFERIRRCEYAVGSGTCPNVTRSFARIVETKPESYSKADIVVTENNGHTRVYRDLSRRSSLKHKSTTTKRTEGRSSLDNNRAAPSLRFKSRRESPISRSTTPNSAPPRMSSFPQEPHYDRDVHFTTNGTAVYDLPPSLSMPRAMMNERQTTNPPPRRVSFTKSTAGDTEADQSVPRRPPNLSLNPDRRGTTPPPIRSSPGLSRIPSIRHKRTDSAQDDDDNEHEARASARAASRRQLADLEASKRRQEDLEAAEDEQIHLEGQRARLRRETLRHHRDQDPAFLGFDDHRSWSRHTSPVRSSRLPIQPDRQRYASSSPRVPPATLRAHNYGPATVHHYPADGGRADERERSRALTEELRAAVEEGTRAGEARWEQRGFDEFVVNGRESEREYVYFSEGSARERIQKRREGGGKFWS